MFVLLCLLGAAAAGVKLLDTDYVATVQSFEYATGVMSLAVHRTSNDVRETVVSGTVAAKMWNGDATLSFASNFAQVRRRDDSHQLHRQQQPDAVVRLRHQRHARQRVLTLAPTAGSRTPTPL
jgi:hypothetical protein